MYVECLAILIDQKISTTETQSVSQQPLVQPTSTVQYSVNLSIIIIYQLHDLRDRLLFC